jgi:hypothetical protein
MTSPAQKSLEASARRVNPGVEPVVAAIHLRNYVDDRRTFCTPAVQKELSIPELIGGGATIAGVLNDVDEVHMALSICGEECNFSRALGLKIAADALHASLLPIEDEATAASLTKRLITLPKGEDESMQSVLIKGADLILKRYSSKYKVQS